ncbi:hypothetical protein SLS64_013253 [Diaporthe eres]|uniref:Siderophore iron transporter mirB n=1 Tax=Diaporthe eres TaxID=83184 RepID=A0ABR1P1A8_DIAER
MAKSSDPDRAVEIPPVDSHHKHGDESSSPGPVAVDGTGVSEVNNNAQIGVQEMEATTLIWTKPALACLFIGYGYSNEKAEARYNSIWFIFLVNGFRLSILSSLTPYVTSEWGQHSLIATIKVVSYAMAGAVYIPMAKLMDVWGRAEGFLLMVGFVELGLILTANATNLTTYCAAQVFYTVGYSGLIYAVEILAIDASDLRNRALAFAFTSSPYMITAFAGPAAAEAFLLKVSWEWGFGAFAIIMPFVTLPVYALLKWNLKKAKKLGMLKERVRSGRTLAENFVHWFHEFDVVGVFLFAAGLVIFLLPFTIAALAPKGWSTPYIIAMLVLGLVLCAAFAIWEIRLAPVPFLAARHLQNRTLLAVCLINTTYQMAYYCWNSYFTSFLQVVNGVSVAQAGYINNTFQVVSGVELFIVGYFIRRTGKFKWTFYPAIPLYIFAQGLMIYFRRPGFSVGYLIMCEIFISMGGAVFILVCQIGCLAAVEHQYVAPTISMVFVFGTVGGSIGSAISGAIWTNTFLPALARFLPESAKADAVTIYSSIVTQLSYPEGSVVRAAIQEAYGYAQTRMLAAGTGIMSLCFIWVLLVENLDVKNRRQTKGTVL